MNAIFHRTRNVLALGIVVVIAAAASLVSAQAASACAVYPDGSCISTRSTVRQHVTPSIKLRLAHLQIAQFRR